MTTDAEAPGGEPVAGVVARGLSHLGHARDLSGRPQRPASAPRVDRVARPARVCGIPGLGGSAW